MQKFHYMAMLVVLILISACRSGTGDVNIEVTVVASAEEELMEPQIGHIQEYDDKYSLSMLDSLASGEYQKVIKESTLRMDTYPKHASPYIHRGNAYKYLGEFDLAVQDYSEGIRLDPNYPEAYQNRGSTRVLLKLIDQAIEDFTEAIRLDPTYLLPYLSRGGAYYKQGQFLDAVHDLDEYISRYQNRDHDMTSRTDTTKSATRDVRGTMSAEIPIEFLAYAYLARGHAYLNSGTPDYQEMGETSLQIACKHYADARKASNDIPESAASVTRVLAVNCQ